MFPTRRDFEQMALHSSTGLLVHEAASKNILWANPVACRMFGFSVDEFRLLKAHHMSSQERQYRRVVGVAWLQEAVTHGVSQRRWKYRGKDGHVFLTDATARLLHFEDGPMVVVQFRPIDDEVQIEAELERTTGYLERIMMHASSGLVLLDDQHVIQDISVFAARLFRRSVSEMTGRPLAEFAELAPDLISVREVLARVSEPLEVRMRPYVESDDPVWLSGVCETIAHDGIESLMVVVRDITSRVRLEEENRYQQVHLEYLSRYNAMGDMAMVIAHELGQPLASATNYLSGLQARLKSGSFHESDGRYGVERALEELSRSSTIVSRVKRYVQRIETNPLQCDLNAIVLDACYFAKLRGAEQGVEVRVDLAQGSLDFLGEPVLLGQAILNFCSNAIEEVVAADCEQRWIGVSTGGDAEHVWCAISDPGRGLEPLTGDRLMQGTFSTKSDGSGIGLILSERIIHNMGGEMCIAPNEPVGTVITVRMPRIPDEP